MIYSIFGSLNALIIPSSVIVPHFENKLCLRFKKLAMQITQLNMKDKLCLPGDPISAMGGRH